MPSNSKLEKEKLIFERLKYEHKETLELGKYFYTTIFKLAPMTFVFNATLLAAFQFLVQSKKLNPEIFSAPPKEILLFGFLLSVPEILPKLIGIFGIIYNIGAWVSYHACSRIALSLTQHFIVLDKKLGSKISECGTKKSDYIYGLLSAFLTHGFFIAWVFWRTFYMWKITPALFGLNS
jgi:hypothetical protein